MHTHLFGNLYRSDSVFQFVLKMEYRKHIGIDKKKDVQPQLFFQLFDNINQYCDVIFRLLF